MSTTTQYLYPTRIKVGAEVLAQMDEKFKELAMGQAVTAINEMIDKKFPDAGRFTRGS